MHNLLNMPRLCKLSVALLLVFLASCSAPATPAPQPTQRPVSAVKPAETPVLPITPTRIIIEVTEVPAPTQVVMPTKALEPSRQSDTAKIQDEIVGEWQLMSGDMCSFMSPTADSNTVVFFKSGSVSLGTLASTYTWADDKHIQIALAAGVFGCILEVRKDGDKLVLTGGDAGTHTLVRKPVKTSSAGPLSRDEIIGEWQLMSGDMCSFMSPTADSNTVVFFKSGSVSLGTLASTYTWADDKHIQIALAPGVFGCVLEVRKDGDKLVLTGGNAGTHTLVRKK